MIEFKMDRRVFYGLMTVLGVGLALGLGLLLGRMMSGGEQAAAPAPAPAVQQAAQQPAGVPPVELPIDDPAAAVDLIQGGGQAAQDPLAQSQMPPASIDYAALGVNADGELTPEQDATVPRISQADAETKLDDPNVVWVDVRSDLEFEQGHIPGAVNIVSYVADDQLSTLPKDKELILYCA